MIFFNPLTLFFSPCSFFLQGVRFVKRTGPSFSCGIGNTLVDFWRMLFLWITINLYPLYFLLFPESFHSFNELRSKHQLSSQLLLFHVWALFHEVVSFSLWHPCVLSCFVLFFFFFSCPGCQPCSLPQGVRIVASPALFRIILLNMMRAFQCKPTRELPKLWGKPSILRCRFYEVD